jgi:hypothetical protein
VASRKPIGKEKSPGFWFPQHMDNIAGVHDPSPLKPFRQGLNRIAAHDAVLFDMLFRGVKIGGEQLQPDFRLTEARRFIDPQSVWAKDEAGGRRFVRNLRKPERLSVEIQRLLILVRGNLHRNINSPLISVFIKLTSFRGMNIARFCALVASAGKVE